MKSSEAVLLRFDAGSKTLERQAPTRPLGACIRRTLRAAFRL